LRRLIWFSGFLLIIFAPRHLWMHDLRQY
jgi:hypothetical protein